MELSAAQAFRGRDVPADLLTQAGPPEHWRPMLDSGTLWVAEGQGGGVVAFLAATPLRERLHIDEFDVAREAQGRGLGRRMLAHVVDWAARSGFAFVSLTTFEDVPWNAPFYRSCGFEPWTQDQAPDIQLSLAGEASRGLKNRCAMRLMLQRSGGA